MKRENIQNKNNSNNAVGNGFLLGVLIGVILTLLITTKKGREILKDLLDRGIEKISNLEDILPTQIKPDITEEENDYVKQNPEQIKKEIKFIATEKKENTPADDSPTKEQKSEDKPSETKVAEKGGLKKLNKRLFFRRGQKKS